MTQCDSPFCCVNRLPRGSFQDVEDRHVERGNLALLQRNANEKTDHALADGAHVMQRSCVEIHLMGKEIPKWLVLGLEITLSQNLPVAFHQYTVQQTGSGIGRICRLAKYGSELLRLASNFRITNGLSMGLKGRQH